MAETLREIVERVRAISYGRNTNRSPDDVLVEGRGTCSTKHGLLARLLAARPEVGLELVHRVYRLDRAGARRLFGEEAARLIPEEGLVDVHTYATVVIDGRRTIVDVTFPSDSSWDGVSDMPLACGPGTDVPATADPWVQKQALVAEHCDQAVREAFIAALSAQHD